MMDFIKGALTEESKEALIQQEYVKQSQRFHGARSYSFISDYYEERQKKQSFIEENLVAQGFDKEEFLKLVAKEKSMHFSPLKNRFFYVSDNNILLSNC